MKHHETLAPSSFPALSECPCFISGGSSNLNEDASKGSLMHEYCALLAAGGPAYNCPGLDSSDREDCEFITTEALKIIRERCPGTPIEIENEVTLFDDDLNVVTFGTADLTTHNQEMVVVLDWKSGFDFNAETHNYREQLAVYALCQMRKHNRPRALCIEAMIIPRKLFPYYLTYDEAAAIVESAVRRQADPERHPQPCHYCKWCAALLTCPAINTRMALVAQSFSALPAMPEKLLSPETITDPQEMSRVLIFATQTMRQYIKRLAQIMENIEGAAMAMSDKEVEIPDFLRVTRQGRKTIADPQKAFQLSGLDTAEFFPAISVSLPKLAEAYAAKSGLAVKEGRKQLEKVLAPVIELGAPTVSLEWKNKV